MTEPAEGPRSQWRFVIGPFPKLGMGSHMERKTRIAPHVHDQDQLLYPGVGLLTAHAEDGAWVVPPERAVWVPANVVHSVEAIIPVDNRSLFFSTNMAVRDAVRCEVIEVSALLHELIMEAFREREGDEAGRREKLLALLVDEIRGARTVALALPHPRNRSLGRLCEEFLQNPVARATIDEWSAQLNMSRRSFTRLFRVEMGMSFADWRQHACLFKALPRLGKGEPVTSIAFDLGYSSTAAFTTMFRRIMGQPPTKYFGQGDPQPLV